MPFTLTSNASAGFYMFSNVMLVSPRSTVPMYVPWTSASCANISCGNPSVVRKCCTLEPNLYRLSFSFFIRFSIFGCKSNIVHHICQHSISVESLNSVNALVALSFVFLSFGLIHFVLRLWGVERSGFSVYDENVV